MDRIYGPNLVCFVCQRAPHFGWVYECKQDLDVETLHDQIMNSPFAGPAPEKSDLRQELEAIGMSESVIQTAEKGDYTPEQLEKLKNQKKQVNQTVEVATREAERKDVIARLASMARAPFDGAFSSLPFKDMVRRFDDGARAMVELKRVLTDRQNGAMCGFRACQTCRPYFSDRCFIDLDAVLKGDFPPMTQADLDSLPLRSSLLARTIGMRNGMAGPSTGDDDGDSSNTSPSTLE